MRIHILVDLGKACAEFNYDLFARVEAKYPKSKPIPNAGNKGKINGRKKMAPNGSKTKQKKSK